MLDNHIFTAKQFHLLITMKQKNNLCYWEAPCPITPRPATEICKQQPWIGKKKGLEAKTKAGKKAHLA